jgi:hypothetical protein
MPPIASRLVPLDETKYERVDPPQISVPPTTTNVTLGPGLNTTLRSPLPPIYAAADNIRQFYTGGQTPQYRVLPVSPLKQS